MSIYSNSDGYKLFRSWIAQQKIALEDEFTLMIWKYYDSGPKDQEENIPLVFIPGVSGTAESFYRQFLSLCPKGYRLISVQFPCYMSHEQWCKGFDKFLDQLHLAKIHLFGTSLGGYLVQCFAQYKPHRVQSMVLCNSFSDTQFWKDNAPCAPMFQYTPEFLLKKMVLSNFPTKVLEVEIANSIDFMVEQLESLNKNELVSRLTLNCTISPSFNPMELPFDKSKITIIDALDDVSVPEKVRNEVYKLYPEAKIAELKTGGNFPFLSRADELNMYLQVHLRRVNVTTIHSNDNESNDRQEEEEIKDGLSENIRKEGVLDVKL